LSSTSNDLSTGGTWSKKPPPSSHVTRMYGDDWIIETTFETKLTPLEIVDHPGCSFLQVRALV
jgi:hypothetical protein